MSAKLWLAGMAWVTLANSISLIGFTPTASAQSMTPRVAFAPNAKARPTTLESAWKSGNYDLARKFALQRDDAGSLLIRSQLAQFDGKFDQAQDFAASALQTAGASDAAVDAEVMLAKLELRRGEREPAEARLRRVLLDNPSAWTARYALAELLIDRGQPQEARVILEALQSAFNNGLLKTAEELTTLGKGMVLLGGYRDANYAFERALGVDKTYFQAHLAQGLLFLSKYNNADAEKALEQALAVNPNHPELLVAFAQLEFATSNDFVKMYGYLDRAAKIAPADSEMLILRAVIAIYEDDCERASGFVKQVLVGDKNNLEAKTLVAACDYFSDKTDEFERVRKEIFALRADYASFYERMAHFYTILRGYPGAIEWYRRALEIDPQHSEALTGLGLGLSRTGHEDEAVDVLRQAFAADPYNVRVYNTLEMYEKVLPDFVVEREKRYQFRAHKSQYSPLHFLMDPVIKTAMTVFDEKYNFKPEEFLAIEVFHEPTIFAVRGVGLPQTSPHGLCFGKLVLSRSPSDGNFNWRQVMWHELAHVYHLQLSNYRVPRWFTEGLAEYETNIYDSSWSRYHDQELAQAIFGGKLPSVEDFNRGFTHARSMQDVLVAYHLASLAIHYIVETHGFDSVVQLLQAFGEGHETAAALGLVLKQTPEKFDASLRRWLERRYMGFRHQLFVELGDSGGLEALELKVKNERDNAKLWAHLAAARIQAYDKAGAIKALERAVELAPDDAEVRYIGARVMLWADRVRDAYEYGQAVLDAKKDSYELRVLLGRAAFSLEDYRSAQVHLQAATELYADGYEAWELLSRVAKIRNDSKLEGEATTRMYELDQHDAVIARKYALAALKNEDWKAARDAARRWVDIRPFETQSHLTLSQASLKLKDLPAAEASWQVLLAMESGQKSSAYIKIIEQLVGAGQGEKALEYAEQARAAGVNKSSVDKALKGP